MPQQCIGSENLTTICAEVLHHIPLSSSSPLSGIGLESLGRSEYIYIVTIGTCSYGELIGTVGQAYDFLIDGNIVNTRRRMPCIEIAV